MRWLKSHTHCPRHWNLRRRNDDPNDPKPNRLRLDPRLRPQVLSDSSSLSDSPDPSDSPDSPDSSDSPDSPDSSDSSESASVHYKKSFSISISKILCSIVGYIVT